MSLNRIREQFADNIEHSMKAAELLPESISAAGDMLVAALLDGGRLYLSGQSSGAVIGMHMAAMLLGSEQGSRPSLPAQYLQDPQSGALLRAFGQRHDILLLINPDRTVAEPLLQAARDRDMRVILICSVESAQTASLINERDLCLMLPGEHTTRLTETALLVAHALCDHIEQQLFGDLI